MSQQAALPLLALSGLVLATALVMLTLALIVRGADFPLFGSALADGVWSLGFLTFAVVGALVVRRHPRLLTGWIFVAIGLLMSAENLVTRYAFNRMWSDHDVNPIFPVLARALWIPPVVLMTTLLPLTFPDGRVPSRRWRPVAWISLLVLVLYPSLRLVQPGAPFEEFPEVFNPFGLPSPAGELVPRAIGALLFVWFGATIASVAAVALRFRSAGTIQRLQLKWLVYGTAIQAVILVVGTLLSGLVGQGVLVVFAVMPVLLPVATGLAILRYRLFDIDVIIRRTLVYGALTTALGVVYFGSVVLLQGLFDRVTDGGGDLAIIISTLGIAALFNPLRRQIQEFINRRFYRRKYDAEQVLVSLSASLRDEVDLDRLSSALLAAVEETMQPAHVSLWLREVPATAERGQAEEQPVNGGAVVHGGSNAV